MTTGQPASQSSGWPARFPRETLNKAAGVFRSLAMLREDACTQFSNNSSPQFARLHCSILSFSKDACSSSEVAAGGVQKLLRHDGIPQGLLQVVSENDTRNALGAGSLHGMFWGVSVRRSMGDEGEEGPGLMPGPSGIITHSRYWLRSWRAPPGPGPLRSGPLGHPHCPEIAAMPLARLSCTRRGGR
jgi:hypothetical protein